MPSRSKSDDAPVREAIKQKLQTPSGVIHSIWEQQAPITLHGYLPYFSEYLLSGDLFSTWHIDCPLEYRSNNAPKVPDVLGTAVLSVLSGHTRFCHSAELYGDEVAAELLGINKVVSHDSLSRALGKMEEDKGREWMQKHLLQTSETLLQKPYILDMDPTVKVIYGHQEGATKGYNPTKPGRPSLCYHTYFVANLRLLLDVDVRPGNETAGCYSHTRLWSLLDQLPDHLRPSFVRGDIAFGNEATIRGCEERGVNFLFKLRQSKKVKELIKSLAIPEQEWEDGGDGWRCVDTTLRLSGWTKARRVVVYRRQRRKEEDSELAQLPEADLDQPLLPMPILTDEEPLYDYSVLVTSLDQRPVALGQSYRDRADCENCLDELKNQWGWGGFTSQELKRTQLMASIVALIYNWWNIFCRLAEPDRHMEATTSRPAFQKVIGRLVKTGGQKIIRLSVTGETADWAQRVLTEIGTFLEQVLTAAQLTPTQRWAHVLSRAFSRFIGSEPLHPVTEGDQLLLPI
ncbi:hypothetical protein BVY04_00330 [bacterium M21]|nr:hypothetical protein BVY04_00330 [bacterium M21]